MMSRIDAKVVLLGKSYAGKTCLVNRYTREAFDQNLPYQNVRLMIVMGQSMLQIRRVDMDNFQWGNSPLSLRPLD